MHRTLCLSKLFRRGTDWFAITESRPDWACRPSYSAPSFATGSREIHGGSQGPRNFYEIFPQSLSYGPPPRGPFFIDLRQLRKEFLQLQQNSHPDRHPPEVKRRAEAISAHINEAYKTLQDPLLRAQYLLSLRGFDVAGDETAKVDDHKLLMEVLDAREEIEAADEEEQLLPLKETNTARIDASVKALEDAFGVDDLMTAREETMKLRYWFNIRDSLATWEKGKPVVLAH